MSILSIIENEIASRAPKHAQELLERLGAPDEDHLAKALEFNFGVDAPRRMLMSAGYTGEVVHKLLDMERNTNDLAQRDHDLAEHIHTSTRLLKTRTDWELVEDLEQEWEATCEVLNRITDSAGVTRLTGRLHAAVKEAVSKAPADQGLMVSFRWAHLFTDLVDRTVGRPEAEPVIIEQMDEDGNWQGSDQGGGVDPETISTGNSALDKVLKDLSKQGAKITTPVSGQPPVF